MIFHLSEILTGPQALISSYTYLFTTVKPTPAPTTTTTTTAAPDPDSMVSGTAGAIPPVSAEAAAIAESVNTGLYLC